MSSEPYIIEGPAEIGGTAMTNLPYGNNPWEEKEFLPYRFFIVTGADSRRLSESITGMLVLGRNSTYVGNGPDGYYSYTRLIAGHEPPADAGDDQLHAAAFGRGKEPRSINVKEVSVDQASHFVSRHHGRGETIDPVLVGLRASSVEIYRTYSGGWAAWSDEKLVRALHQGNERDTHERGEPSDN